MEKIKEHIINLIENHNFEEAENLMLSLDNANFQKIIQNLSEFEIQYIFGASSDIIKEKIVEAVDNNNLKEFLIDHLSSIRKYEYIKNNRNELRDEFVDDTLKDILGTDLVDLKKKILFEDKQNISNISYFQIHELVGKKFVKENINEFLKMEFPNEDIEQLLAIIQQIETSIGDNIYINTDFRILEHKYIDAIGIDGITSISIDSTKQSQILSLNDQKIKILSKCLEKNPVRNELDDYKNLLERMLSTFSKDEYNDLINDIEDIGELSETDIRLLNNVFQNKNRFEIRSLEDLRNYEELKRKKCNEWIKSENIEEKRLAVLEKVFGQDIEFSKKFISRFSKIEELENSDIRQYMQSIKKILEIDNSNVLERVYNNCSQSIEINELLTEKEIQKEFGKLFNDGLFKIDEAQKIEENIYEAGTNFKMIVHCRQGSPDDYFTDWNRDISDSNDYICASYIRNDMIATYGAGKVLYGFNDLQTDSICGCVAGDGGTGHAMQSLTTPNDLINSVEKRGKTKDSINCYNEINYKRFCDGKRQQPNYIVVFRVNGEIDEQTLKEAQKAQKQWNNELPIVIVDVNKCLEAERQKVEEMKREYLQTKSPILAREIYHKIKNNQATIAHHKGIIKTTFFEDELDQYLVSDKELEQYLKEHPKEQSQAQSEQKTKIGNIYNEITTIISERELMNQNNGANQNKVADAMQDGVQTIETEQTDIEITPKDIAKLDQNRKLTTTEVKQNIVKRLLDKVKEKFIQGKNKDGR